MDTANNPFAAPTRPEALATILPEASARASANRSDAAAGKAAADDPIILRFESAALTLPRHVRNAVSQRVREYLKGEARVPSRRKRFRREKWQHPKVAHSQ
jgi:hypothetical protein